MATSSFALPFPPQLGAQTLRASRYQTKKRNRRAKEDEEEGNDDDGRPASVRRNGAHVLAGGAVERELATLSPALFAPGTHPRDGKSLELGASHHPIRPSLRQHHRSILTTVLHRCLLDGDDERAGRAWALNLRTTLHGKPPDLRSHGQWGIGAEILFRRSTSSVDPEREDEDDDHHPGTMSSRPEALARVKEYYERLILQYPYHRRSTAHRKATALDFYPAMFAWWIYSTQSRGSQPRPTESESDDGRASEPAESHQSGLGRPQAEFDDRDDQDRIQADAIAARMDEIMLSPPYSDSVDLWHLRGMVARWIADLCIRPPFHDVLGREDAIRRARLAFDRVRTAGGTVWNGLSQDVLEFDVDDSNDPNISEIVDVPERE